MRLIDRLPLPLAPPARTVERIPLELEDGARTTLHLAAYDRARIRPRVVVLPGAARLAGWCRAEGVEDAIVGGFFIRRDDTPLGEVRVGGRPQPSVPFDAPWDARRACVHLAGDEARIARRDEIADAPPGDLLQAGPLLVAGGASAVDDSDREGFSAGARQFDSDITIGRYPRAALAIAGDRLLAAVCEGRAEDEAGLTLGEFARALADLGAESAINLDGGGSASLVCDGRLVNRPREEHGIELLGGRPVATALAFEPRRSRAGGYLH